MTPTQLFTTPLQDSARQLPKCSNVHGDNNFSKIFTVCGTHHMQALELFPYTHWETCYQSTSTATKLITDTQPINLFPGPGLQYSPCVGNLSLPVGDCGSLVKEL